MLRYILSGITIALAGVFAGAVVLIPPIALITLSIEGYISTFVVVVGLSVEVGAIGGVLWWAQDKGYLPDIGPPQIEPPEPPEWP